MGCLRKYISNHLQEKIIELQHFVCLHKNLVSVLGLRTNSCVGLLVSFCATSVTRP